MNSHLLKRETKMKDREKGFIIFYQNRYFSFFIEIEEEHFYRER